MPDVDRLLNAIDQAEESSYGADTEGQLSAERAALINLYLGEDIDPAPPAGRSQVVDRSVFETVQWILPSLCRVFAGGSDLVMMPPLGPDDEESAKQEAEYLNWVITQQNPWFEICMTWFTDALMTRNAYAMAYVDKQRITEIERYERQTEEGVALLMQDKDVEVVNVKQYPDTDSPPQMVPGPDGQPMPAPPAMLFDLEIRRVAERRKHCIRVLPPERCKISQWTPSYRLSDCDYFEYWEEKTISALRADGFKIEDDIADDYTVDSEEDAARDQYDENRDDPGSLDPSMRRVRARMIWIRHDFDEDGIAEMQYVVRVGRTMLHREECSGVPVACLVPSPLPHRHIGISIGDMMQDIQRIKTVILRQGLDNLYLSNNPQKIVNQHLVNLDDVMQSVPGGITRTDDVNAVRYEIVPFVFPQAMEGLEYMDQIKENRAGVNRYFTGIDQNALNKTATGVQQLSTMAAQRVEQIARIFGSGIEDLARIVHELILKGGHKKEVVKLRGQWVEVDPATWRKRTDFKISVGFAAGNKDAMVGRLTMIAQAQLQALEAGIPIASPQNLYESMLELTKASDFSSPERFWTDPSQVPQQPAQPAPEVLRVQADSVAKQAELQLQQETKTQELALREKEITTKAELEKYRIDTEAQVKVHLANLQSQSALTLEEKKGEIAGQKQDKMKVENLDKLDEVVEATQEIAESSAEQAQMLAESLVKVVETLSAAVQQLTAPKVPIRDKSGKIVRIESAR